MDEISIEKARPVLGELVDRARFTGKPTMITRQGKAAAALVPVEWFKEAGAALTDKRKETRS